MTIMKTFQQFQEDQSKNPFIDQKTGKQTVGKYDYGHNPPIHGLASGHKYRNNILDTPFNIYKKPKSLEIARLFGEINFINTGADQFYCRPQDISIVNRSKIEAKVTSSVFLGMYYKLKVRVESEEVTIYSNKSITENTIIYIKVNPSRKLYFN